MTTYAYYGLTLNNRIYTVFHKATHYLIAHNFGECWPIFIFSQLDSAEIV